MAAPKVAIATRARSGGGRCMTTVEGQRFAAKWDPPASPIEERTRCTPIWPSTPRSASDAPRRPWKTPGAEHPQEEGPANNPSADSARPDTARWSGARRAADLRAVRQDRDADEERGGASPSRVRLTTAGQQPPHYGGRFPLSPTLERVRTTDVGSVADWDDHRRRKVVKMILCRESGPGGLSPCLGSGRGRRYARQRSSEPAAPAGVAETRRRGWVLAACSLLALRLDRRSGHVADMTASGVDR